MELHLNDIEPRIMHVDLNSAYAMIEQQANPLLRGKSVGVSAYDSPGGFIVASSYEAKRQGIKLMRNKDARKIDPNIYIKTPDPEKYFDAHRRFRRVLEEYSASVTPKSIDEYVLDMTKVNYKYRNKTLFSIGHMIKRDIKKSLGSYCTVNIGIGPNRFLAKIAAGIDKPDGMDMIRSIDVLNHYGQMDLLDIPGINVRYRARLILAGITSPLEFYEAPMLKLRKQVFKSIVGYYWYLRLRGYEVDSEAFATKSFGNDYAVGDKTRDPVIVFRMIMKLCEKTGRRIRHHDYQAQGVSLYLGFENRTMWHKSKKTKSMLYATQDIYLHMLKLLGDFKFPARVTHISVTVFNVVPATPVQTGLFDGTRYDTKSIAVASDVINNRYGEFTVTPASMANMKDVIIKRVPFGSVRDI